MAENKKYKELVLRLQSGNKQIVIKTIEEMRHHGMPEIIPVLADLLAETKDDELQGAIQLFLNDLKDKAAVPVLVELIKKAKDQKQLKQLLLACWNNGLDYSPYLNDFVDAFIRGDFETAIEAFTVIENMDYVFAPELINGLIFNLKDNLDVAQGSKKSLIVELVHVLEKMSG